MQKKDCIYEAEAVETDNKSVFYFTKHQNSENRLKVFGIDQKDLLDRLSSSENLELIGHLLEEDGTKSYRPGSPEDYPIESSETEFYRVYGVKNLEKVKFSERVERRTLEEMEFKKHIDPMVRKPMENWDYIVESANKAGNRTKILEKLR